MTKSKTSTIAIVVLSVLLAAALASTIVLAAFTFTRTASTTITFNGGITVTVTGITGTQDPYAWNSTVGSTNKTDASVTVTGAESVSFDAISATVAGQAAYVAVKADISNTGGVARTADYADTVIDATTVTELTGKTGWYIVGTGTTASLVQTGQATSLVDSTVVYTYGTDTPTQFDGASYTGTVKIVAAITLAELATLMV